MSTKIITKLSHRAISVILSKFTQLHLKGFVDPLDLDNISYIDKKKLLRVITLLTEKQSCKLKGRNCADGQNNAHLSQNKTLPLQPSP